MIITSDLFNWQVYYAGNLLATISDRTASNQVIIDNIANGTIKTPCPPGAVRVVPIAKAPA